MKKRYALCMIQSSERSFVKFCAMKKIIKVYQAFSHTFKKKKCTTFA